MNTRLQVEHPVTELRTGLDLVALQILIASGERLPFRQEEVTFRGHAIECRICAEDVENNYLPATGRIMHLRTPAGPGIREDRGVQEGGEISRYYDSMIAKLAVWGVDRPAAIARMKRALREYELLGVVTNISLCTFVMEHPAFAAGNFTTNFLAQNFDPRMMAPPDPETDRAIAVASAILAHEAREESMSSNGTAIPTAGRWRLLREEGMRAR
jgi:acetyl/propionyl-CoA carboxylase alpha subunit